VQDRLSNPVLGKSAVSLVCGLLTAASLPCRRPQLLEALFRARWGRLDGLGALVLTPTRELAMQIFEELRRVGRAHALSAGMLIGGKNVKAERDLVNGAGPCCPHASVAAAALAANFGAATLPCIPLHRHNSLQVQCHLLCLLRSQA
jgi:hypothetical protein